VPPTERRVLAMLEGTRRAPDQVVAAVPPDLAPCSVEKVAINAVMAGCKPEYLPVVLAAVEAACTSEFNAHGLLATTMAAGPVLVVNGPIRRAIGMNSGRNVFGQGNRANLAIGRALQLVIRNVGGGRPGEVDRATFGSPGKLAFCFAEDEEGRPGSRFADLGARRREHRDAFRARGHTIVTSSREPDLAGASRRLRAMHHPKLALFFDAILAVSPEHARIFREAGWSKAQLRARLLELLQLPGSELVRGAGGIAEGLPEGFAGATIPKFRPDGLLIVHCGGGAGLFSAIIAGWVNGEVGSRPVLRRIET
jgi:hypothetical protein